MPQELEVISKRIDWVKESFVNFRYNPELDYIFENAEYNTPIYSKEDKVNYVKSVTIDTFKEFKSLKPLFPVHLKKDLEGAMELHLVKWHISTAGSIAFYWKEGRLWWEM